MWWKLLVSASVQVLCPEERCLSLSSTEDNSIRVLFGCASSHDVAQDDHNTAMGTAGTAAHASASGRQTEQADAACPVSGVRDICHVNLIPTPALFQQGISNAAAENPWDAADKQLHLIRLQHQKSGVKSYGPTGFPRSKTKHDHLLNPMVIVVATEHTGQSDWVTCWTYFLSVPVEVQLFAGTKKLACPLGSGHWKGLLC